MLSYLNFKPNFKLRLCRARELLVSQLLVTTGVFELQISCIWVLQIRLAYYALWSSELGSHLEIQFKLPCRH